MCGIVGIKSNTRPVSSEMIVGMRDTFVYRGPDDKGEWTDVAAGVALGHRRLSIIDISPRGRQPMLDEQSGRRIVFNGEIYNYIEIREDLTKKGHQFVSESDTEVILKAYTEYGRDCVKQFNGMFSFAIWDPNLQEIFLARDRLGIKPLYYYIDEQGSFLFASEVKAILKGVDKPLGLNVELIDQYMSFGYIPGEDTLKKNIKRLLPGCSAVFSNGNLAVHQYWQLNYDTGEDKGFDYYLEESRALLTNAIDIRLRSDVPLGVFLSGGIDSSAVVGLMSQRTNDPIKTFSVAYDFGKGFDETAYARMVSKKFDTDHHEIYMTPNQFRDFIPDYIRLMDEPVTESAAISLYFVSKLAKEHVTVVLSGEGSDEIFGGYDFYRYMLLIEKFRKPLGGFLANTVGAFSSALPIKNKVTKYLSMAGQSLEQRYKGISTYEQHYKALLYNAAFKNHLRDQPCAKVEAYLDDLFTQTKNNDDLSRMLYFDIKTWLLDDLLIKADRMSMAASVELRVPFLDYRLVELAARIPTRYKVRGNQGKYILKKMMEGLLPDEVIYRPKMGFPTPLKLMFQKELRNYAQDVLLASQARIHDFFVKSSISRVLDEHSAGVKDHHRAIWQLLVLEQWLSFNN